MQRVADEPVLHEWQAANQTSRPHLVVQLSRPQSPKLQRRSGAGQATSAVRPSSALYQSASQPSLWERQPVDADRPKVSVRTPVCACGRLSAQTAPQQTVPRRAGLSSSGGTLKGCEPGVKTRDLVRPATALGTAKLFSSPGSDAHAVSPMREWRSGGMCGDTTRTRSDRFRSRAKEAEGIPGTDSQAGRKKPAEILGGPRGRPRAV